MKLLVDTKAQRVVYAKAGKEVIDFLFSLLALPLSTVTKLLATSARAGSVSPLDQQLTAAAKRPTATGAMVGSVGNLYRSVESLDGGGHVCCHDAAKDALLKPATIPQLVGATPTAAVPAEAPPKPDGGQLFRCKGCSCSSSAAAAAAVNAGSGSSGGYVWDTVMYTVMDDLSVVPISTITAVAALVSLGVTDISGL
ncbi:uncharacterized protein [Miscanthus floridulus]|uniref:uncharacterized protein n=1 Tax=Miscanthus floridulus TaxID=154761 RepID=UPI00345A4BA0